MKKYTNILSLVVAILMIAALFCGCESEAEKIQSLAGTWYLTISDTETTAQALLENVDFYPEEIACVDLTTLKSVKVVTFTAEKTYSFAYDADGTRACTRAFFEAAFDAMYENRASLGQLYDVDFEPASKEEFRQFYAELYSTADYSGLLDALVENGYDYDELVKPWEEGSFTINGNVIAMTILGQSEAETLKYSIEGDALTLTYADGVEVYSRSK
ncbi:MAG: hypothetical protein PUD38_01670 [Firmicutes bacterium]|nr:hypothetical protein [Bacillota bacterium]